jgi:hypothetical protein
MRAIASVILFILSFSFCSAQNPFDMPVDSSTGLITYRKIIEIPNKTKDVLYDEVKKWLYDYYESPKNIINVEDRDLGVLLLNPSFIRYDTSGNQIFKENIFYSFKIETKDNKIRTSFYSFANTFDFETSKEKTPMERAFLIDQGSDDYKKNKEFRVSMKNNLEQNITTVITSLQTHLLSNNDF